MKAYRLTPLEQLQLEKKRLKEECKITEKRMAFQMRYLSDNWRSMIRQGVTSSIKSKVSDAVSNLSSKRSSKVLPYVSKPKPKGLSRLLSSNYKTMASTGWGIMKPVLWTFLTKKVTSMLFGRKKKKRRRK